MNLNEFALIKDIQDLQAACRRVIRGLDAAPITLQDSIGLAMAQWCSTMSTVIKTIEMEAELREQKNPEKPPTGDSN